MTNETPPGRHYNDPDERLTVVSWTEDEDDEPLPLFAVETKRHGIEAASALVDEHGGRARWTVVNLKRINSYGVVTELFDRAEAEE